MINNNIHLTDFEVFISKLLFQQTGWLSQFIAEWFSAFAAVLKITKINRIFSMVSI